MTHDDPERRVFDQALDQPAGPTRDAWLANTCAGDPALEERVRALLYAHEDDTAFLPDDDAGTPSAHAPSEKAGDLIGRYKLLQQIGEGGFGTVWMAEQTEPVSRRVALKIIKLGMDTREVIARFEQERQALAMMDHPNIAKVLDAGATDKGRPFFVMELVKGMPITRYCDEAGLGTRERLALFGDVCAAINHAHQKGIIHRDIKPSNVMVTLHGDKPVVKVIDFGIAKATQGKLTDKTLFTKYEQMIGTPAYMSPEQASLSGLDVDTRSDIYALGILLYELLTGKPPFDARSLLSAGHEEMRRIIREVEPARPSSRISTMVGEERTLLAKARNIEPDKLNRLVEQDLDWIVMKAIEKDRSRRYETANGLAADIVRFLDDEPVSAAAPGTAYKLRKFARRNKPALRVAGAIAAVLVAATAVSTWQAVRATRAEKLAQAEAVRATGEAARATEAEKKTAETLVQVAAERDAKERARKDAEDISTFLADVFQSPDPARDGRTITVAETLDKAARKLDTDLAAQPAIRASLQGTLAQTYLALGLPRDAVPLVERALGFCRIAFGPEHSNTIGEMDLLATCYSEAGFLEEALRLREEVLPLLRRIYGPEDPIVIMAMGNLAISLGDAGRLEEAIRLQEETLALHRKINGSENRHALDEMGNLAVSLSEAGRRDEALRLREEVLALRRRFSGPEHPSTISAMNNLALSYQESDRGDEALKLTEETLELSRKVNSPEHPDTIGTMNNLASCLHDAGRRDEALRLREEVLGLRRKFNGPEHPDTLKAMSNLAESYKEADRDEEALRLWEETLALSLKVFGPEHRTTLGRMTDLSIPLSEAGRLDEAIVLQEQSLAAKRRVLPPDHTYLQVAQKNLATLYRKAGRGAEALTLREEVVALSRKAKGPEHSDTVAAIIDLAYEYMAGQNYVQAEPLWSELLAHARESTRADTSQLEWRLGDMAELRYRQKRYADAEAFYRERMEIRLRRAGSETSDTLLGTRASLGRLYSDWAWAERTTSGSAAHQRALEGEKLLRETMAVREADAKWSAWRKADLQSRLGGALSVIAFIDPGLTALTREPTLVKAEAVLVQASAGMEQDKNTETKYQRDGIERLIRLYEAWPKPDKLAEWKQKLAAFDEGEAKRNQPGQP